MTGSTNVAGTEFGRYVLQRPLGAGGMAVVYRAFTAGPNGFRRDVVIKRIAPSYSQDESFRRLMAIEASLLSRLIHPSIVQLFEFGEVDGECFLAMELVEGVDFGRLLGACRERGQPLPSNLVARVGLAIAEALAFAHEFSGPAGPIIHRDVSPSNVMVSYEGDVKLLDFGIAKASHHHGDRTATGVLKGKLTYMAPEQLEGGAATPQTDLYALGVLMHEGLTGHRLFTAENDLQLISRRRAMPVVPKPSASGVVVPLALDDLVAQMLANTPAERPPSARAVAEVLRGLTTEANDRRALAALVPAAPPPVDAAPTVEETRDERWSATGVARPPARPWRWLGLLGGGAVLAAVPWVMSSQGAPAAVQPAGVSGAALARAPEAPAPPTPAADERAPRSVRLDVSGAVGAVVTIDGVWAGKVPFELELAPSSAPRRLRATLGGHEPFATDVVVDANTHVSIAMRKTVSKPPQRRSKEISDPFGSGH